MKKRILQCFNKGAETYDHFATVQARVAEQLMQRVIKQPATSILEIGCGTGLLTMQLLPHFPNAFFQLTDIAPAMIDVCKKRFSHHAHIHMACMDGEALADMRGFDLIVSSMTLHWFVDIKKSFHDIIKKLLPGGRFMFAMLGHRSLFEWKEMCNKINFPISTPEFPNDQLLQNEFPGIKIEKNMLSQCYENSYDFLNSLKKIGATASHPNHQPVSPGKLRKIFREFDQEIRMSYEIIYGTYHKK